MKCNVHFMFAGFFYILYSYPGWYPYCYMIFVNTVPIQTISCREYESVDQWTRLIKLSGHAHLPSLDQPIDSNSLPRSRLFSKSNAEVTKDLIHIVITDDDVAYGSTFQ